MSGAIWSAAERKSFEWRRIWPRWRNRKASAHAEGSPAPASRRFALLGSYENVEAMDRAAEAFAAAAFSAEDAVLVRASRPLHNSVWRKVVMWVRPSVLRQAAPQYPDSLIPLHSRVAAALLDGGGGFVLVRNPARFPKACEIIERTGGRVGCVGPVVTDDIFGQVRTAPTRPDAAAISIR